MKNIRQAINNTSGVTGVVRHSKKDKWVAQITVNQKSIYLGYYDLIEDAIRARSKAEIKYRFHDNHGQIRPL